LAESVETSCPSGRTESPINRDVSPLMSKSIAMPSDRAPEPRIAPMESTPRAAYRHVFAICTLVTDIAEYDRCRATFAKNGFNPDNSEFLWIDNTQRNEFDGYSGITEFVRRSSAKYVVICHQDIALLEDGFDALVARLSELDKLDGQWAVAGNAGLRGLTEWGMRITDPWIENARIGEFPMQVDSLDENFLVINAASLLTPSSDLSGFHFYGLDLCLQARSRGCTTYVIDFHLRHNSGGTRSKSFYEVRSAMECKYAKLVSGRAVRTPCGLVFLGWCAHMRFLRWPLRKVLHLSARFGLIDKT
jgi:hypothetical protein